PHRRKGIGHRPNKTGGSNQEQYLPPNPQSRHPRVFLPVRGQHPGQGRELLLHKGPAIRRRVGLVQPHLGAGGMKKREGKKVDMTRDLNVEELIQVVMREAYLENTEDLRAYAETVRYFNKRKKAVREYLAALREFKAAVMSAAR